MGHIQNNLFSAVILVGGESTRMGTNKYSLKIKGSSFIDRISNSFSSLETVFSVHDYLLEFEKDKQIIDVTDRIGPLGGIYSSLIASRSEYTFFCSCDLPNVTESLIMYMIGKCIIENQSVVARIDGKLMPTFAIYNQSVAKNAKLAIKNNDYRLMNFLKTIEYKAIDIPNPFVKELINVNNYETYNQVRGPYTFAVSGYKNSGKTTLINKLLKQFKENNFKVACLKHDGHDFLIDTNTDTGKFIESGSDITTIYSKSKSQSTILGEFDHIKWIDSLVNIDIVIIEGMKDSPYPKLVLSDEPNHNFENCLVQLNSKTRNDIDMIYKKIIEEYDAR